MLKIWYCTLKKEKRKGKHNKILIILLMKYDQNFIAAIEMFWQI